VSPLYKYNSGQGIVDLSALNPILQRSADPNKHTSMEHQRQAVKFNQTAYVFPGFCA